MPEQIMDASGGPLWRIDSDGAGLVSVTGTVLVSGAIVTNTQPITTGSQFTTTIGSSLTLIGVIPATSKTFVLTHENTNTLWIGFASPFTFGSGLPLLANQYLGFDNYTGSVWGIGSPTTSILVQVGVM